jgi:predicted dehydrogenase
VAVAASSPANRVVVAYAGGGHPHVFSRIRLMRDRPDVEVAGIYDPEPTRAEGIAERTGIPVLESLDALATHRPDIVVSEALDHEMPAIGEGLAGRVPRILLEKPGGPDLGAVRRTLGRLEAAGTEVELGYQLHYTPGIDRVLDILRSGALGQLTLARFHASTPIGCGMELWQSLPEDLGGLMFTEGCHMLELILTTLGTPASASGTVRRLPAGASVTTQRYKRDLFSAEGETTTLRIGTGVHEDVAVATLNYPDLVAVLDLTGWEADDWVSRWTMEYYGTLGTLQVWLSPPSIRLHLERAGGGEEAGVRCWTPDVRRHPTPYQAQLDRLIRRARGEETGDGVGAELGLDVVRVLDAIYRSSGAGGGTVAMEPRVAAD